MTHEMYGYDYGIKPRVMALGDIEFPSILKKSFEGLAYTKLDHFGVIVNPPLLGIIFANENDAKECFSKFKRWAELSNDGDAVGMGFIEFENNEYGLCIYPESSFLIDRMFSKALQEEITPIVFEVGYLKLFPKQSEYFHWFKSAVKSSPFVVAPGTVNYGSIMDLAFRKLHINFFSEKSIPENTMESVLLRTINGVEKNESENQPTLNKADIYARRKSQLDRFFPVTQEIFRHKIHCQIISQELIQNGFSQWQITQAICNLALIYRNPEIYTRTENRDQLSISDEKTDILSIIEFLISDYEQLGVRFPPEYLLTKDKIQSQIALDSDFLLDYFREEQDASEHKTPQGLQEKIIKLGLL